MGSLSRLVIVTTIKFGKSTNIGDPISVAKIYQAQAADELIFVDIEPGTHPKELIYEMIKKSCEEIFMPITVGGGVKTIDDFKTLLHTGADKVSINTAAVEYPDLIKSASEKFGAQCVVCSIDYKKNVAGEYEVFVNGGKTATGLNPVEWAVECERRGAGEILATSIDNDGTRQGLNIEVTRAIANVLNIPLIASGGCGYTKHFIEGYIDGHADAVSAGTYFCFKDENPMQTRGQIANAGVPIRLHS